MDKREANNCADIFPPDTGWGWLYYMVLTAHWPRGSVCPITITTAWQQNTFLGGWTHTHTTEIDYYMCADKYICLRILPKQIVLSRVSTRYATSKLSMRVFQNHTKLLALLLGELKLRHLLQQSLSYFWEDNFRLYQDRDFSWNAFLVL